MGDKVVPFGQENQFAQRKPFQAKKGHRNLGLRVRVKLSEWVQGSEHS